MRPTNLANLAAQRVMDPELAALMWLLVEGGVHVVVVGSAPSEERAALAAALLSIDPKRAWLVLDADVEAPTVEQLSALLQGGAGLGIVLSVAGLQEAMERLAGAPGRLPPDAIRRLGMVVVADHPGRGLRLSVVHYLRPAERDGQGHVQRRPPAVLAAWDETADTYEHYAWGITPELADRVDRSQADFEERQKDRAGFLTAMARAGQAAADEWATVVARYLTTEPTRTPAPPRPSAGHSSHAGGPAEPRRH